MTMQQREEEEFERSEALDKFAEGSPVIRIGFVNELHGTIHHTLIYDL